MFFGKDHLVKIKTMTHKLTVVIYRSILMEFVGLQAKEGTRYLKGKKNDPVHSASCSLSWAM